MYCSNAANAGVPINIIHWVWITTYFLLEKQSLKKSQIGKTAKLVFSSLSFFCFEFSSSLRRTGLTRPDDASKIVFLFFLLLSILSLLLPPELQNVKSFTRIKSSKTNFTPRKARKSQQI